MKYYDSDTRQLVVQALTPATNVFMRLMLNPADIENDFNVSLEGDKLILSPKKRFRCGYYLVSDQQRYGQRNHDKRSERE